MSTGEAKVGSFYDTVWTKYIPEYKASKEHLELLFNQSEIRNKRILDAGCGTGIFSIIFAQKGAKKVVGIDISEASLNTGKKLKKEYHCKNLHFQKQDMIDLPFKDNTFDIIWSWGSIHHTTEPSQAINELIRVLKKEGTLLLAMYKYTKLTFIHERVRKTLIKTPRILWIPLSKILCLFLYPLIIVFKKREKLRKGEKLEELILDWYFVPIRHYSFPDDIKRYLENRGLKIEKYIPTSGRFDSTSNFIFKAYREN